MTLAETIEFISANWHREDFRGSILRLIVEEKKYENWMARNAPSLTGTVPGQMVQEEKKKSGSGDRKSGPPESGKGKKKAENAEEILPHAQRGEKMR